jgi:hypothetical protein
MQNAKDKIKQAWEENPLAVIAVGAAAVTAVAKLADSMARTRNSRAWKVEVARRNRATR